MKQKDIKLLWGRSGNRCAICKKILTQDESSVDASQTLGEQAHIVAESEDGPRGKSSLSKVDREGYHNRILLCPNHHKEIDTLVNDWPIEKLHQIKSEHELWVLESLSDSTDIIRKAEDVAVSNIIDRCVQLCHLSEWVDWTSIALSPIPKWQKGYYENIYEFRQETIAAIWPSSYEELMRAAQTLSIILHDASNKFMEHAIYRGGEFVADQWYKARGWNENYDSDLADFENWIQECHELIYSATKAANWLADVVRRDFNPMFFAAKGRFIIHHGPFENLTYHTELPLFTEEEKCSLPDSLLKK